MIDFIQLTFATDKDMKSFLTSEKVIVVNCINQNNTVVTTLSGDLMNKIEKYNVTMSLEIKKEHLHNH